MAYNANVANNSKKSNLQCNLTIISHSYLSKTGKFKTVFLKQNFNGGD